jgi:GntR family transcriptional regulator / MocR family aminotransferase
MVDAEVALSPAPFLGTMGGPLAAEDSMEPLFEVQIELDATAREGMGRQLFLQLKAAILDGRLRAGTRLPPTRKAKAFFRVSRNTATEVYERLMLAGYVVGRQGAGTFVAQTMPAPARRKSAEIASYRMNPFWTREDTTRAMGFWQEPAAANAQRGGVPIDFRPALVDPRLFPFDVFRRVSARQLRTQEKQPARFKSPQGNQGNYLLRQAITAHIALTRAVVCDADAIVVTSGAQQAFDLLARVLVTPQRTVVAVEDPGYPPLRVAFAAAGADVVPVPVDSEGMIVERIPANAHIVCLTPSHQFPTGVTTSARRRNQLIAWARKRGGLLVEDDYDGEFRYGGSALEALRASDSADVVFYVGTFSKCMLPALRLGFIVAPKWALTTLVAAKNCLDWHCSIPMQLAVAAFISEGHLARHVRKLRHIYGQRRQVLLRHLDQTLGEWLQPLPSSYGMHVTALARAGCDVDRAVASLRDQNIRLHTLERYFLATEDVRRGIVFGYGAANIQQIDAGIAALRTALQGQKRPRGRSR